MAQQRLLFNERPGTWQELQEFVGKLFREIGYQVEVSKVVELVRGQKEIDVFVQDNTSGHAITFLIECKNWNKPVDQETVHGFRTIVADFGANFGFIVSKSGFQAGSYNAAKNTHITLVSLEELESRYYEKWQSGMVARYLPFTDALFPYWDPTGGKMPGDGKPISWDMQQRLSEAYDPIVRLGKGDLHGAMKRDYPYQVPVLDDSFKIVGEQKIRNDRDYFDFIETNYQKALRHFKLLYRE